MTVFYVDQSNFIELNELDESKEYLARRVYSKLEMGVEFLGMVSSMLIKSTLIAHIKLGLRYLEKLIPGGDV